MQTVNSSYYVQWLTEWKSSSQAVSCLWFWWIPSSLPRQSILMKWITLITCHLARTAARFCTVHSARASLGRMVSLAAPECVEMWPWRTPLLCSELDWTHSEKSLWDIPASEVPCLKGSQLDSCFRISKPYADVFYYVSPATSSI